VQIAALRLFNMQWRPWQRAISAIALLALFATFIANVIPIPAGAAALYPYVVIAWIGFGLLILREPTRRKAQVYSPADRWAGLCGQALFLVAFIFAIGGTQPITAKSFS
jgi:hypothetical protein